MSATQDVGEASSRARFVLAAGWAARRADPACRWEEFTAGLWRQLCVGFALDAPPPVTALAPGGPPSRGQLEARVAAGEFDVDAQAGERPVTG